MAVSSLKGCWYKFSARVRDYLDLVESYHRSNDGIGHENRLNYVIKENSKRTTSHRSSHKHSSRDHSHSKHKHSSSNTMRDQLLQLTSHHFAQSGVYSKRKTAQGQIYFIDAQKNRYWHDPSVPKELLIASLDLDSLVGRLSSTWEVRRTPTGKTYYVNHIKKTTQFTDPRLIAYKDHLMRILRIQNPNLGSYAHTRSTVAQQTMPPNPSNYNANTLDRPPRISQVGLTNELPVESGCQYQRNLLSGSHHNLSAPSNMCTNSLNRPASGFIGRARRSTPAASSNRTMRMELYAPETTERVSSCQNSTHDASMIGRNRANSINDIYQTNTVNCELNNTDTIADSFNQTTLPNYPINNKELFDKISILRQELMKQQYIGQPCRIDINRKKIFEESFRYISQTRPRDLKKRLLIKFKGEEGLDYGGLAREWFYLLSREILNPVHGLFQYTSDDIYNLQINPDSGIVYKEHLLYMNFCGRVMGMAVFHGHFIEGHFTLPFYKMLLNKPITLDDIEMVDPDLHRSLCWILENDITNVIDTTFLVQHNAFGQLQEHELKPNGRNIAVTESNKNDYVDLYVNYRCRRGIQSQFCALLRGFHEMISPCLLENFDEHELELLIGGLSKINVQDWRSNTKLKNCHADTPMIKWFWDIVESYSEEKRARLLQFVTGSPRVPIQGFKYLQGVNSEPRLFTIHLIKNACTDNLPKSHTCFNRIDLPTYETYDKLHDKLTQAIEETMGFSMQ